MFFIGNPVGVVMFTQIFIEINSLSCVSSPQMHEQPEQVFKQRDNARIAAEMVGADHRGNQSLFRCKLC